MSPSPSRPLRNRVDPFGELHASPARGGLMGNRGGRFHRDDQTLGERRWTSRTWIACVLQFKNRAREVWGPGYTELFFFDEPSALAAGHRPCFECRRAEAVAFQRAWRADAPPRAPEMDAALHRERLDGARKRLHRAAISDLPDGAMIAREGRAFAIQGDALWPWSFYGYGEPLPRPKSGEVDMLTPPSIVAALRAGYKPRWGGPSGPAAT
jgi:hypothetical protein